MDGDGGGGVPPALEAEDYCYLSTTGRVTGELHTIEIWFAAAAEGRVLYLLAGGGERSDWVKNLRAEPSVAAWIGNRSWRGHARVVDDPLEVHTAAALVFEKYQPRYSGDLAGWRDRALPVAVAIEA